MTAVLEPLENEKQTRVKAEVERGDAPDDFTSPAFRAEGLTMALFAMALEGELNDLTMPSRRWGADCQAIVDNAAASNMADQDMQERHSLSDAMGDTAKMGMKMEALEASLREKGCDRSLQTGYEPPHVEKGPGGEVTFEAGKPMVDLSRR